MDLLFLKIILVSSCCGWCYTEKLTPPRGYLDFLPRFYPKFLQKSLSCSYCTGGWISIAAVIGFYKTFGYWTILNAFTAPCCTMAITGIILHLNTFYGKYQ